MKEHYLLTNANVLTMDHSLSRHTALAVEGGRIKAVGSEDDMAPFKAMGWPETDLDGATVLPGFADTHQHLGLTGQVLGGLDFLEVTTLDEVFDQLRDAAQSIKPGQWILGYTLNDIAIRERRMPTMAELDAVCPDHPVMIVQASWHLCGLNSKGLALLDLPDGLPGMDVDENGRPTGLVRDPGALTHVFPALSSQTPKNVKLTNFQKACEAALAQGITTLHCLEGGEYGPGDPELILANLDKLPLHTILWNQEADVEGTRRLGLSRIGGCICADGAVDVYTAALSTPYTDRPETCGTLNFTQTAMDKFIMEAHTAELQISIHCEGDAAVEQVLSAIEKALKAHPRDNHRHRIEHCEIIRPDQVERMAEAGILAGMQPAFFPYLVDMDDYVNRFGKERMAAWFHPYRTMVDSGVIMSGGSDCPITPHGPLVGIAAAVCHPNVDQRLTPMEAIRMFTSDAAYSGFEENERGSIETGKIADLVVLSDDPTRTAPDEIRDIKIIKTIVEGKPVEDARDGPVACSSQTTTS